MGSQLRLSPGAGDKKNLEALLETEAETKRAAEVKNVELMRELEDVHAQFSDLKMSNEHLSQRVAALQEQVSGEEKLKAAFEEFKRYEDDRVEQRCAELDARLDALRIDFDEELYPHMLTAIAGRRWVIRHGLRLAMMKCAESLEMRQAFADVVFAQLDDGTRGARSASKDGMPMNGTYSMEAVRVLDTHQMDLFSLIRAPNPKKVKTGSRPRAPHELPLLTLTAPRVIEMDEPAAATDSSGVPSAIERSPLNFAYEAEASGRETAAPEMPPPEEVPITTAPGADQATETVAVEPPAVRESRKRGHKGIDANAPPKSLRRDHADLRPSGSSRGGKSLAAMQL
nr:hypothetical protein [Tanacetum cinerariifolium]